MVLKCIPVKRSEIHSGFSSLLSSPTVSEGFSGLTALGAAERFEGTGRLGRSFFKGVMTPTDVPSLLGGDLPVSAADTDLVPLLRSATNAPRAPLVGSLTDNNTGRISSQLNETMASLRPSPAHRGDGDARAADLPLFGGNTMAHILRGHRV